MLTQLIAKYRMTLSTLAVFALFCLGMILIEKVMLILLAILCVGGGIFVIFAGVAKFWGEID